MAAVTRVKYADYTLSPEQVTALASEFYGRELELTIVEDGVTGFDFKAAFFDEKRVCRDVEGDKWEGFVIEPSTAASNRDEFKRTLDQGFRRVT